MDEFFAKYESVLPRLVASDDPGYEEPPGWTLENLVNTRYNAGVARKEVEMAAFAFAEDLTVRSEMAAGLERHARRFTAHDALFSFAGRVGGVAAEASGAVLVSDAVSGTIWRVTDDGAGTPVIVARPDPAPGREQPIPVLAPAGLAVAPDGTLLVADDTRHRICAIAPDGTLRVVAGGSNGYRDGPAADAMFRFPSDLAVGADGTCYVADTVNDRIRAIAPDGVVTTLAGSIYHYGDGRGPEARFRRPVALDIDTEGTLYVADTGNNAIRRVTPDGEVTTVAGMPLGGDNDGQGRHVGLRGPSGIAVDVDGSLWVADHGNSAVRRISAAGESTTELRFSGRLWPTAVALRGDGRVAVTAEGFTDTLMHQACIMVIGGVS
jgi:sugar lactone lactonase YvrE